MWSISVDWNKLYSFLLLLFFVGCQPTQEKEPQRISGFALGTSYSVTYLSPSLKVEVLQREIDSVIEVMNASMSTYVEDSAISKINRGDSLIEVDDHFEKVYAMASEVWEKTQGYFDPTVGALVNAYGFGPDTSYTLISENQRDEILTYTGWNKTKLTSKKTVWKEHPQVYFDFNALAKGYAVDVIANLLRVHGSTSFLVEIGGEIVAEGLSPKSQQPWKVAIDDPRQTQERSFIAVVPLTNQALATSGNYRKFKIEEATGKRLVHSINPKTGNPFPTEVLSASVIAPTCMEADAYATALMVMPLEESRALIERESNLEAYWIVETEDGTVEELYSSGFFRE
jgi:thiamine biosynthesis lipoprotein